MVPDILITMLVIAMTYPLSHLFFKKGMMLDGNINEKKHKTIGVFFYVPLVNLVVTFFYMIWMLILFKKEY